MIMIRVNRANFERALSVHGFSTVAELCAAVGVHRNSISRYLCGAPVLPKVLDRVFEKLELNPSEALYRAQPERLVPLHGLLAPILSKILKRFPKTAIVLFGSRAKGSEKRYSDIDLGVISDSKFTLNELSELKEIVESASEDLPYLIDIVDLSRADESFRNEVKSSAIFLGGDPLHYQQWLRAEAI